ncbi:tryptophan 7-halogenase [Sulfuracidifex metallicus DSM 6482 = JCM 9184]|nr:tryptophan 7-halogenase [Sulfuracidifex metallicus DSM 6482 = JCM 9184]
MAKKKIVVVGGGIAGMGVANTLSEKMKDKAEITVINKEDFYISGPSRLCY